jgi:hypothetical protein
MSARICSCMSLSIVWYWYQNLGGAPPPRPTMPFLENDTCEKGGGIYFCQGCLPCMMPSMDGWRDKWMDGWMGRSHDAIHGWMGHMKKLHEKWLRCLLLYVIRMKNTSFSKVWNGVLRLINMHRRTQWSSKGLVKENDCFAFDGWVIMIHPSVLLASQNT